MATISRAPLSFDAGDLNLYRNVFNNPIKFLDSSGEVTASCLAVIGVAAAAGASAVVTCAMPPAAAFLCGFVAVSTATVAATCYEAKNKARKIRIEMIRLKSWGRRWGD